MNSIYNNVHNLIWGVLVTVVWDYTKAVCVHNERGTIFPEECNASVVIGMHLT